MERSKPAWRCEIEEKVQPIFQRLETLEGLQELNIAPDMEAFHKNVVGLWKEMKQHFERLDVLNVSHGPVYDGIKLEIDRLCQQLELMSPVNHLDNLIALSGCMDEK